MQEKLRWLLMRDGPQPAATLAKGLGISQPTFSRLVRRLGHEVVVGGRSRQSRYAARRSVPGVAAEEPVFRVDVDGEPHRVGTLVPVHPGFLWEGPGGPLWTPDLPWFLADLRPAGFLGRQIPRQHPALAVPDDVRVWTSDHVLRFATRHGHDLPGHLIVGEPSLQLFLAHPAHPAHRVEPHDCDEWPRLADDALAHGVPGSWAAGEQPKFLTARRRDDGAVVSSLVKFSPPMATAVGRRVADLLVCEHHALRALSTTGLPVAPTRVVVSGGRTFLEVERFDRVPATRGRQGRRGVISLAALDAAFVGSDRQAWSSTTKVLLQQRRVTSADHRAARLAQAFGTGIDNSDMHLGNFALFVDDALQLAGAAPVYDMLPMLHAPVAGQLVPRVPPPWHPSLVDDDLRDVVVAAVQRFWQAVADDSSIADDLRRRALGRVASV
jgi:hypothetical protein